MRHADTLISGFPAPNFPVLLADPGLGTGPGIQALQDELACRGLGIIGADGLRCEGRTAQELGADGAGGFGAALLDWDLFASELEVHAVLDEIAGLGEHAPVVLLSDQPQEQAVPATVLRRTTAFFWLRADSPRFVAQQVERLVHGRDGLSLPSAAPRAAQFSGPPAGYGYGQVREVRLLGQPGRHGDTGRGDTEGLRGWARQRKNAVGWASSSSMTTR